MMLKLLNNRGFLIFGTCSAAVGYIFSIATGSIGIAILVLAWLTNFKTLNFHNFISKNAFWPLILFFLLLLFSSFYSTDFYRAQKFLIRFVPFILFPMIFQTVPVLNAKEKLIVIKTFIYALSVFFLVCFLIAIVRQIGFWNRGGIFNWYYFYRYDFLEVFEQHPTYLSMFTLLSLSFILFLKKKLFKSKLVYYIIVLIQTLAILLYGSRIGYILFLLLLFIFFYKHIKSLSGIKRLKQIGILILFFLGLCILAYNIPIVKERIIYSFGASYEYKFNDKESIKNGMPEEQGRLLLWQDAIDLIKLKPILGYGTGKTNEILQKKYKDEGHFLFLENKYNAHNSYLETLLIGGAVLLITYLLILFSLLRKSIKINSVVLFIFSLILILTSITETIFVSRGVQFVAFFYCFLLIPEND